MRLLRSCGALLCAALVYQAVFSPTAHAITQTIFLDFGPGWSTNMATLASDTGIPAFTPAEIASIEAGVLASVSAVYSDFPDLTFTTTLPAGSFETIDFNLTPSTHPAIGAPSSSTLGIAPFDWYNFAGNTGPSPPDPTAVFPANFDTIVDEHAASVPDARPGMIAEITAALAGTAAHELGHSFGLSHHDSYGTPSLVAGTPAPPAPFGIFGIGPPGSEPQNSHILATGITGLGEAGRETTRTLSTYSKSKLEITSGGPAVSGSALPVSSTPFTFTSETGAPHDMDFTAQDLDLAPGFQPLPISGTLGQKVHGGMLGPGGSPADWYMFVVPTTVSGPALLSAEIISLRWYGPSSLETTLTLYSGTPGSLTMEMFANDLDYGASFIDFDSPAVEPIQEDPLMLNVEVTPGATYFLEVTPEIGGTDPGAPGGFYDLYINLQGAFVPEPSTYLMGAIGFAALALLGVRRKYANAKRR